MQASMKRFILISAIVLFSLAKVFAQENSRALIVAISDYQEESGWKKINCSKDIELIRNTLLNNGFQESMISVLKDSQATKENIIKALCIIEEESCPGDNVFIHFSCHGQQITDINGDESDGLDEALIPYDASKNSENGYLGEDHLTDDELNVLLSRIRKQIGKEGLLLVLSDACHSGNNTRADEDSEELLRGTREIFIVDKVNKPKLSKILKKNSMARGDGLITAYVHANNRNTSDINWIPISACPPDKSNYEVVLPECRCGRLSYAFSRCFHRGITVSELVAKLQEQYKAIPLRAYGPKPTPYADDIPESMNGVRLF